MLAARDEIDTRISQWNREAAKAGLAAAEIIDGRVELIAERELIEAELETLATQAEPGDWERLWQEISRDPRAVIETIVGRVTVRSAGGRGRWTRVGDRVTIEWRGGVLSPTEDELRDARAEYESAQQEGLAELLTADKPG